MPDRFPNLSAPTTAATIEDEDKIGNTKQGKNISKQFLEESDNYTYLEDSDENYIRKCLVRCMEAEADERY